MAEDDIYNNRRKYENFKQNLKLFLLEPSKRKYKGKYYCRNKANLVYFERLFAKFEATDISYVRRCRLLMSMKLICHAAAKKSEKLRQRTFDNKANSV